jgi:hypothetical protein
MEEEEEFDGCDAVLEDESVDEEWLAVVFRHGLESLEAEEHG